MLKKIGFSILTICLSVFSVYAQVGTGTLKGKVTDESGEGVPFATITVKESGTVVGGGTSEFDGTYIISALPPGTYEVEFSSMTTTTLRVTGVVVNSDRITFLDKKMQASSEELEKVIVVGYKIPLINRDGGSSGGTVTREAIKKLPLRSPEAIASTTAGVGPGGNIRGARGAGTFYYIDGVKVRGSSNLPKSAIEEVSTIVGGLPANYGDATGGVISITTRGAPSRYFGSLEYLTSGFLINDEAYGFDNYAFNLVEGSIGGPLAFKKDSLGNKMEGKPTLGFFFAGNYTGLGDQTPTFGDPYKLKDDVRDQLLADPIRPTGLGSGINYNSDFLGADDFERIETRPNNRSNTYRASLKFDVNVGKNSNLAIGGSGNWSKRTLFNRGSSLMNWDNYGIGEGYNWRAFARFTQRFDQFEGKEGSASKIKNAFYFLMLDYERVGSKTYDENHRDRIFNYGYVGDFVTLRDTSYAVNSDGELVMQGFRDTLVEFTPSQVNSDLAAVTTQYFDVLSDPVGNYQSLGQIQGGNALINGDVPQSIYGIWANLGTPYGSFSEAVANQFRITGSGSVNLGNHAISLGFEFEQRLDKAHAVSPIPLWETMRSLTNKHITELDTSKPIISNNGTFFQIDYPRLNAAPGAYTAEDPQAFFDFNLRKALGLDPDGVDFIDVDALDPDLYQLEFFSADELLNNGNSFVGYNGYDVYGNSQKKNPNLNDFFTAQDEFGNLTRPIAPFEPTYIAGYLMDKFSFDDIIFNIGVRVDRYDANQDVLKDPYLLQTARTAGEVTEFGAHPTNISDDYVVYVNDINNPSGINGYRDESTWFNAAGVEVKDPSVLRTGAGIAPYLVDPDAGLSTDAFEDFDPNWILMPRLAFSFPISEEAVFFAHYDVLSQRPTSGNILNPINYLFIEGQGTTPISNPNLRPTKTVDYEVGFQQALNRKSALKLSAYVRQLNDEIQSVQINEAYPATYITYGNIDFGTVKGFSAEYDLRRSGNLSLRTNYTLQFADATGSGPNTGLNLAARGESALRNIFPTNQDRRHTIVLTLDYRYGSGKAYNGPKINGKDILERTGFNLVFRNVSGGPYTAESRATFLGANGPNTGSLNGSRLPWTSFGTFNIDRDFDVVLKKSSENPKLTGLNVYFRFINLLNTKNINAVYPFTGDPQDDGYLTAPEFQQDIANQLDEAAFRNYYTIWVQNPAFFGAPRTIQLGAIWSF